MTDPQAASTVPPVTPAPAAGPAADQSPLDILDKILKDAQDKAGEATEQKLAKEEQERAAERERQRLLDEKKVEEERLLIEQMKSSPQYLAAQEQRQAVEVKTEQREKQMDGMEILQLQRKKI